MSQDNPGIGTTIYEILGVSGDNIVFLNSFVDVIASPDDDALLRKLATTLQDSPRPEALAKLIYGVSPILNFYKHQRSEPSWQFGTYSSRRGIVDRLWQKSQGTESTIDATGLARSALLLAAQEAFNFADASVLFLLNQPEYERIANWPIDTMIALRKLMEDEQQITSDFVAKLLVATNALQLLIPESQPPLASEQLQKLLSAVEEIALLARSRKLFQWRVANFVWRISNLARSKSDVSATRALGAAANRWSTLISDLHFDRWLEEALTNEAPPPKTAGIRILTPEAFKNRVPRMGE